MQPGQRVEQQIAELRERIRRADHEYYNLAAPGLSDAEYDRLFAELKELEARHPELVTVDSPTQRVGAPLPRGSSFPTVRHLAPMISIESLMTREDVVEFDARAHRLLELEGDVPLAWACEPKLDGVSANLLYEDGVLVRGLSRGDGEQGEDITRNLRTLRSVPLRLHGEGPFPRRLEVRGEVIMTKAAFQRLQESSETSAEGQFRNARNTVAGTLKLLDPEVVAGRPMDFLAFAVGLVEGLQYESYGELRQRLGGFGFRLPEPFEVVHGIDALAAWHDRLEQQRDAHPYEMDGMVGKLDRIDQQRHIGRTARTPRWALAYKFAPRIGRSRVVAITANVGRTGAVTPVAQLQPVELAGVTVRNASLHNWGLLRERDVRPGDEVLVQRAGDVIPEIVKVFAETRPPDSRPVEPPAGCPACNGALEAEGAFLYCINVACPAQLVARVVHLASRRALDIEGLGPKQVAQLHAAGLLQNLDDVFRLPARGEAILALERWGERSFAQLAARIEAARTPPLARFLNAIGIRHVGEQTAKDLAVKFGSLERLQQASREQLLEVDGVGDEVADSVLHFFAQPQTGRLLAALAELGVAVQQQAAAGDGPLAGRLFVFTGGLQSLGRDEAKARVERLGARTTGALSKKVTDVVVGEAAGSKLDKAKKLGLRLLTEAELLELIGGGP